MHKIRILYIHTCVRACVYVYIDLVIVFDTSQLLKMTCGPNGVTTSLAPLPRATDEMR